MIQMVFSDANLHFCLLTLRLITTWSKMKEKSKVLLLIKWELEKYLPHTELS